MRSRTSAPRSSSIRNAWAPTPARDSAWDDWNQFWEQAAGWIGEWAASVLKGILEFIGQVLAVLVGFAGIWALDGFNSYTTMLTGRATGLLGYAPQPWLRLFSGVLMGMGMSVILVPAFNQIMWADGEATPTKEGSVSGLP